RLLIVVGHLLPPSYQKDWEIFVLSAEGSWVFVSPHGCECTFLVKISFLQWMPGRFDCTCARLPVRGSSKRPSWLTKWKPPFVVKFPRTKWRVSSITLGFRFRAST